MSARAQSTTDGASCSSLGEGSLAARYLDSLLRSEREAALSLVRTEMERGLTSRALYLDVLAPAMRAVGELWEQNRISVAQEHYCSAVTQLALAEAYPRLVKAHGSEWRVLIACVPGELHEIGARMVADFFGFDGWDATYLGELGGFEELDHGLRESQAQLLGISVTMSSNLSVTAELIAHLRATPALAELKIIFGGRALALDHEAWRRLGGDGYAADAERAVLVGSALLGKRTGCAHSG